MVVSTTINCNPILWIPNQSSFFIALHLKLNKWFEVRMAREEIKGNPGEHHYIYAAPLSPFEGSQEEIENQELVTLALSSKLLSQGCEVEIIDSTFTPQVTPLELIENAKSIKRWEQSLLDQPLHLEQALEIAKFWKKSKKSELEVSVKLETLRQRTNVSSFDWNKYIKKLEEEIHAAVDGTTDPDERLRLELKALAKEDDPVKRLRKRSEIASHYRIKASDIEACIRLLDERSKTPEAEAITLDELFDLPLDNLDYLIPGMLPRGETILFVAAPKTGKTLLAYDVAFAVATGESKFLGEDCKEGKVLIIQCDESVSTAKGRLNKRGFRRGDVNVHFMSSFNMSQLDKLEEKLETFRPALVIIDSLRKINAGRQISENSAEFADNIYQLKEILSRYNASGILIHHSNKNPEAVGVDKVRGSSAIAGATWGVWDLSHIPKPDPNNKKKLIIDPKDPNRILSIYARDIEGQRLKIELDPDNNSWINHGEDGANAADEQERQTIGTQIIELLSSVAPMGLEASEIKSELGCGSSTYPALNRLLEKRIVGRRPSNTDRRRSVYFMMCQQEETVATEECNESNCHNGVHSPPPVGEENDIEFAETNTQQDLEDTYQIDINSLSDSYQVGTQEGGDMDSDPWAESDSGIHIKSPQEEGGGGCPDFSESNCHTGINTQSEQPPVAVTIAQDEAFISELTEYLQVCDSKEFLRDLRQTEGFTPEAFKKAATRLPEAKRQQIKQWVLELNSVSERHSEIATGTRISYQSEYSGTVEAVNGNGNYFIGWDKSSKKQADKRGINLPATLKSNQFEVINNGN